MHAVFDSLRYAWACSFAWPAPARWGRAATGQGVGWSPTPYCFTVTLRRLQLQDLKSSTTIANIHNKYWNHHIENLNTYLNRPSWFGHLKLYLLWNKTAKQVSNFALFSTTTCTVVASIAIVCCVGFSHVMTRCTDGVCAPKCTLMESIGDTCYYNTVYDMICIPFDCLTWFQPLRLKIHCISLASLKKKKKKKMVLDSELWIKQWYT